MKNIIKILMLIFVFTSCKNEDKKTELVEKPVNEIINKTNLIIQAPIKIPKNVDDDFKIFLNFFNKDSVFQVSRVKFPLEVSALDSNNNYEPVKRIIKIKDYQLIELIDNKNLKTASYSLKTKVLNNKATIEINGIDNGIFNEFEFEKTNGKWMLITWNDQST